MNIDNCRSILKDLLKCDRVWIDRAMKRYGNRNTVERVYRMKMALVYNIENEPDRAIVRYGRIWDRLQDLNVDMNQYIEAERKFIESVGIDEEVLGIELLLTRLKTELSNVALRRLNSRQYEYVFNGRVKH